MRSKDIFIFAVTFFITRVMADVGFQPKENLKVELIDDPKEVHDPDSRTNPIFLDGRRNKLYVTNIFTTLQTADDVGEYPPQVAEFMVSQILNNAGTQFSLMRNKAKEFLDNTARVTFDPLCSKKSSSQCKEGYAQVKTTKSNCDTFGSSTTTTSSSSSKSGESKTVTTTTTSDGETVTKDEAKADSALAEEVTN